MAAYKRTLNSVAKATCPACGQVVYLSKKDIIEVFPITPQIEAVRSAWFGCVTCDRVMQVESVEEWETVSIPRSD